MIRVQLPMHLRTLAGVSGEVRLEVAPPVTAEAILDQLETRFPMLRGTIRDQITHRRRPFVRYFGCTEDWSQIPPSTPLPSAIATGAEPFLIVGAIAGG